ncbi:MAG: pentapeptide repeat-containing protein [Aggregatilineales bacterium]
MENLTYEALTHIREKLDLWILTRNRMESVLMGSERITDPAPLPSFDEIAGLGYDVVEALGEISLNIEHDIVNLLDQLDTRRRKQQEIKDAQKRLLRDMHNTSYSVVRATVDSIRHQGWLTGEDRWLTGEEGMLADEDLSFCRLQGANLEKANLEGTNLYFANMMGANLKNARLNEKTRLPDGAYWSAKTDLLRFTNPTHPDFWYPGMDNAGTQAQSLAWA